MIRALSVGILLIGHAAALHAASNQSPAVPFAVAAGSHTQHVDRVRLSNQREYERVLALYDAHLRDHPDDVVAALEKCRFVERFAFSEDEPIAESVSDDLDR